MAFDDVQAKQRLLDEAVSKQRRLNDEINRLSIDQQNKRNQLITHYNGETERIQRDIKTIDSNTVAIQKDIATLQTKQSDLQTKLRELQDQQTKLQQKLTELQKRQTDYSTKLTGIQRDQQRAFERLDTDMHRVLDTKKRELETVNRGLGTLQADLTRAIEKQRQASAANSNSAPTSTAGRQINGLRKW